MADIYISYQNVLNKAGELEELANRLVSIKDNEFDSLRSSLSSNWDGSSAEEMQKKLNDLNNKLNESITELKNAAALLRKQATEWYNREKAIQEAMRLAEEARKKMQGTATTIVDGIKSVF